MELESVQSQGGDNESPPNQAKGEEMDLENAVLMQELMAIKVIFLLNVWHNNYFDIQSIML